MLLAASILIRLGAACWSAVISRRLRDARMLYLTAMLVMMALRQLLTLRDRAGKFGFALALEMLDHAELPGLVVSCFAAMAVYFLARMILDAQEAAAKLRARDAALAEAHRLEAVGRLAGGVAHDFNNQLSIIAANAGAARRLGAPKLYEALDNIEDSVATAAHVTRQLLTFARREIGPPKVFVLSARIDKLVPVLRSVLPRRIRLAVENESAAWTIEAEPHAIEQVVINLVLNARDAITGEGSIRLVCRALTLSAEDVAGIADASPGEYLSIAVEDTGSGIPPDVVKHIFEPFFTTKGEAGTGLGLSVSHGIVRGLGGHFVVKGGVGTGARVELRLPRSSQAAEPAPEPPVAVPVAPGGARVILVDDEPRLRQILGLTLSSHGLEVAAFSSALEASAIDDATLEATDLVVTDMTLPGMTGLELATALRARKPSLRVLFISGYAEDRFTSMPGAEFLAKPFAGKELVARVQKLLAKPALESGEA